MRASGCGSVLSLVFLLGISQENVEELTYAKNETPLWTWSCINERCVSSKAEEGALKNLYSLQTCNMLCGSTKIWPHPTGQVKLANVAVPVGASLLRLFILETPSKAVQEYVQEAFEVMRQHLLQLEGTPKGSEMWRGLHIYITISGDTDPHLHLETDESYELTVESNESGGLIIAKIVARSFCGARHGLETLMQIIWYDPYTQYLLCLETATVNDSPRFHYRGLMVDTARNYLPINDLKRTVDAMATCKMNTFHWHISDSQSFPLKLYSNPQFAHRGAYTSTQVYTTDEIREFVHYAKIRGIRVLIEVDIPAHVGHTWDWSVYEKEELYVCQDKPPWSTYCEDPPCGQLNPLNPFVYDILQGIYREIIDLTEVNDILHLGGDDVSLPCWEERFNTSDTLLLWVNFIRKLLLSVPKNGNRAYLTIFWSSQFDQYWQDLRQYLPNLGIQTRDFTWSSKSVPGVKTIVSHQNEWDLNDGMGPWHEEVDRPYNSWQRVYEYRPWVGNGVKSVIGGEATVWSSTLDGDGLDARAWPRAAALAERLWSDVADGASRIIQARLDLHRFRLQTRGIQASPIWSLWCTQNPYTCT